MRYKIFIVILLLSLAACDEAHQGPAVGVIAPLSGGVSEVGIAFRNGMQLADNGNVRFIYEDSAFEGKQAVTAYHKLKNIDDIQLVMDWGAPTAYALAPITEVPFLTSNVDTSIIQQGDDIVRYYPPARTYAKTILEYADKKNIRKIGIVEAQIPFFESQFQELKRQAPDRIVLIGSYSASDVDFKTSLIKIQESDVDAIGVFLISPQIHEFYKQAMELGVSKQWIGTDFFEDEVFISSGDFDGVVFPNLEPSASFKERYFEAYGSRSQVTVAALGHDLASIVQKLDLSDRDSIMDSFSAIRYEGVLGSYEFVETGDDRYLRVPMRMKVIHDGVLEISS